MQDFVWHHYFVFVSLLAAIGGFVLAFTANKAQEETLEPTERVLFLMSFTYWIVYCIAFGLQKLPLPNWEILSLSLKFTTLISYFLTFASITCLPLHRYASQQVDYR
jgi:hypothetical protein